MVSEQHKWDLRYQARPLVAPHPVPYVEQSIPLLKSGTVLDLASGDGASSLVLAKAGFEVTALDISSIALERLQHFAAQDGVSVNCLQADVEDPQTWLQQLPTTEFDNIVLTRYKPSEQLWHAMIDGLCEGGHLLMTSFNLLQHKQHGFNEDYCLLPGEYTGVDERLHLLYSASVKKQGDFFDEYLFQKVKPEPNHSE